MMKSSLKAYHGRKMENFARGLELLVHFQISLGFKVIGGFSHVASFGSVLLKKLELKGLIFGLGF